MTKEDIKEFACNPTGKARIIADVITKDALLQSKLHTAITSELSGKEIDHLWEEIIIEYKQLKLNL